ncbi:hypothetical protein Clacol_006281 [Clathrus columnatus]|uniref:Adenylosuccinate synthetase n=1 Tax=Clathrus columnatus TaxID=1419009 RepID=A0AAV5AJA6_9AGAM|nr:hypothetical protein Clacol_006281 [Clathrus columnatus]
MARRLSKLYKELAELPVYTSSYFLQSNPSVSNIRVDTSVRDFLRKTKRTISKNIITVSPDTVVTSSVHDSTNALASVPSYSGKRLGVLRETFDGTTKKRYVEVWRGSKLEASKDVTTTHEDFHLHPEAKAPEITEESDDKNAKYRYLPDFGEQMNGKTRPTLYLFKWKSRPYEGEVISPNNPPKGGEETEFEEPTVIALKPDLPGDSTFTFGQSVFAPDNKHIYATGYEQTSDGRRLGPHGCWNHPSAIFKLELPKDIPKEADEITVSAARLTPPHVAARSPRVSTVPYDPYTVVWLSNPVGGAHTSSVSLWVLRSTDKMPKLLIDSVYEPKDSKDFPGLYVEQLPSNPFVSLDNSKIPSHIITHSVWGSLQKVLRFDLRSGEITTIVDDPHYSWTITNTDGRQAVLAVKSSMTSPPELMLGQLSSSSSWQTIDRPVLSHSTREQLDTLCSEIISIPDRYPTEVITLRLSKKKPLPMISIPHGGPHVTSTPEFNPSAICLALEGYLINMINYTGSLGFGQKHVDALIGRAGELDVQDSYHAVQHLIQSGFAETGQGKQFVQGGSHGGFLAAHLIGQYPGFFSAAVMRNPVISTGEILSVSDIPDWAYLEFGQPFGPTSTLSTKTFDALQKASPIFYIDAVQTPVLLHIGENDRRVPPSQGRNYYYALKGRGKVVEMLVFPGNGHSLNLVEAELAGFEITVVLGAQWGDEGKGKLVDIMAADIDLCVRCAGGNNAGHTIVVNIGPEKVKTTFDFHLIPSGLVNPLCIGLIGSGVVVHLPSFFNELEALESKGLNCKGHGLKEVELGGSSIGTTKKGIGPAYSAKASRSGLRVHHLFDHDNFAVKFRKIVEGRYKRYGHFEYDTEGEIQRYKELANRLRPYVVDGVTYLHSAIASGKRVLVEGANALMLDIDYGTYPFVTSSSTCIGGVCTGLGIPPKLIGQTIGVVKAYTTRVGGGPFPTELLNEIGSHLQEVGKEYGTTTGRRRRCGWLDLVVLKYSCLINGYDCINVTKLDVLDQLKEIKVAVAYILDGVELSGFPANLDVLSRVKVEYITFPGWNTSIENTKSIDELPENCRKYLQFMEDFIGVYETQPLLLDADYVNLTINSTSMGLGTTHQNISSIELPTLGEDVNMHNSKVEGRAGDSLGFILVTIASGYLILSTWLAILLNDPRSFGLFAFHPPLQVLAIGLFAYGILTLQPTSQPKTKLAGLNRHQLIILGSAFPCISVGTLVIIWNKNIHEKPHFVTWHGTFGIIGIGWMFLQMFLGAGSVWYGGALFGGGMKAKSIWKYHRLPDEALAY